MLGRFEPQKLTSEPQNLQISLSFAKQVSNKIRELGELVLLGSEGNIKVLWAGGISLIAASLNFIVVYLIPILFLLFRKAS